MTRRYKTHYYSSEGMRQLQAQINELWEHLEAVRQAYVKSEDTADAGVFTEWVDPGHFINDAAFIATLPDQGPPPFKIQPAGRGWYQVVDSEGKPIHEGKLRREPADEACEKAMQSAA